MPPPTRLFGSVAALAAAFLLAACVTGSPPPAPAPAVVAMPEGVAFTQLAVGRNHICGLTEGGAVICWGRNNEGQLDAPAGTRFRRLTAGFDFSCGLRLDGALACWGRDAADWLGDEAGGWAAVSAGRNHVCALDAEGAVACWGSSFPPSPPDGGRYTAIGAGFDFSCGLTPTGALVCGGANDHGQAEGREGPFTALAVGLHHLCALRPDGTAFCQGRNRFGETDTPDAVFTRIAAGKDHSCGITEDGALACWGTLEEPPAGPFTELFSGWRRNCALRPDGEAVCQVILGDLPPLNVALAFGGRLFDQPVELFPWPGGGLAIAEREGTIAVHDPQAPPRLVLDLTDRTATRNDWGLLSAALDPDFSAFPYLYVYYSALAGDRSGVMARLSRFDVVDDRVDAGSELVILEFAPRTSAYQGGAVRFGAGMLYLGFGDDGSPLLAQDRGDLRGTIIRIDVRGATAARPYRIPHDNPLLATPDARPEVWAWGLRNPWRMSFDAEGRLWVADVGYTLEEEVSLAAPGANLGWPAFEGARCRDGEERACAALADATQPVAAYGHGLGCAIIGGVHVPPDGAYLFGDHCTGDIRIVERDGDANWTMRKIANAGHRIIAFGTGADGEVYVLTQDGPILRLELPP